MSNRLIFWFMGAVALAFAGGCDIIPAPYLEQTENQLPADSACLVAAQATDPFGAGQPAIVKKVLMEEYTGHQCGNCPSASKVAHRIVDKDYPGRVYLLSIHSGPLAQFNPTASKYFTNFTTPEGNTLYEEINKAFYDAVPAGFFDRQQRGLGAGTWPAKVASQLALTPEAGIRVHTCYEPTDRTYTAVIDLKYLKAGIENDFLSVYLVEDSIVDWQKDYDPTLPSEDLPAYTHRDVFRGSLNGVWGERLTTAPTTDGQRFTKVISTTLPEGFNADQTYVLAFIYDQATGFVRQVERAKIR
jgi:hypothetical protein